MEKNKICLCSLFQWSALSIVCVGTGGRRVGAPSRAEEGEPGVKGRGPGLFDMALKT